ncbi:MAG: sigma-70 family RNA polymerase sigma factor [Verrucomicrobiales bacterium]|nr:sigma-70 family RNA polymerase sigma factor [Verrucomicrobiales bacterium]
MPARDAERRSSSDQQEWFATTHWSVVLAAGNPESPHATQALEKLCRTYWYPLYAYVRRRGYGPSDAQDFAQEFFARLLRKNYPAQADQSKGKFRSFLLLRLNHFLADEYDRASTQKRGGDQVFISLDEEAGEERYRLEPADDLSPEKIFERRWAQTILEQVLARLREEFVAEGKAETYEVLKAFEPGEQGAPSYAQAAARLAVSESAVKSMIHRMRRRHRELVREEIAQTVSTAAEVDEELRHLMAVLAG